MFEWNVYPYTDFNKVNLDWICRQISACGTFWTASSYELILDPDQGTGVGFYPNDLTGPEGATPTNGDAVFYDEDGLTYVAFIDDLTDGEYVSFRRFRLTGPQGEPGTPGGGGTGLTEDIKQALLQLAQKVAYIDANGPQYYQDLYDALYDVDPPATLVSISAVYTQSGTVYDTDSLDSLKTDLVVTATYSDSTTAVIPAADYTLSGSLTVGTSSITVTYGGETDSFNVTVTENPAPPVTLVSIEAVYTQSGTVYNTDSLNSLKTDLVVTATYSDSSSAIIPGTDYTLSGTLTVGTSTITVTYDGETDTFTVTVTKNYDALPAGYTAYDYVRNTATGNNNSAVATGLTDVYANSGYSHEVEFLLVSGTSTSGGLWGLRATTGTPNNSLTAWIKNTDTDNFAVVASQNDTTFTLTASKVTANVMEVTHENGYTLTKFNGSTVANVADKTLTSSGEINLFKAYTASSVNSGFTNCVIRIYSYKVKNLSTDEYAAYMIPCKNSSDVSGFYDTARDTFYIANVSSTLVAENEV